MSSRGSGLAIGAATVEDEASWRTLWRDYLVFYQKTLSSEVTDLTWKRILDPSSAMFARIARQDEAPVGFAVALLHEGSWTVTPICYLEDLFVAPGIRGVGVGRALIDDLIALARREGWSRLYWRTAADNHRARALYDSYVAVDPVVLYELALT